MFGWKIFNNYAEVICGIVAVLSLIKLIEQYIIPNDALIQKMDKVTAFYSSMVLEMESIWFKLYTGKITEHEAFELTQEQHRKELEINAIINEIHKNVHKKIALKAQGISNDFFNKIYNTSYA
ncbi:hypothetical protein GCM10027043_06630 [Ferruginibacter profundus]